MTNDSDGPTLYIDENREKSQKAKEILRRAGFVPDVKIAPSHYRAAYAMPVLFGLFNKFEGLDGIRIFVKNAKQP